MTSQEQPDLSQPADTMAAIGAVALRLLAGAVSRATLQGLQRTLEQSPAEYPWQVVTRVVLAEPVDDQQLVQQGLKAQRDWILRGGREAPEKPVSVRAKTLAAKLLAQLITFGMCAAVLLVLLLALKHKWPDADIYRPLSWLYERFPKLLPR